MKTPLDLTCEYAALDDAKKRYGGALPPAFEKRWAELKAFYDVLMTQNGFSGRPGTRRFTALDIRRELPHRMRLRVPAEMDIFVRYRGEYHTAQVVNLSCGGALLFADTLFRVGSRLTVYLSSVRRGSAALLTSTGEVVWCAERGIAAHELPHRMGTRFIDLAKPVLDELEWRVIETLEQQLLALDASSLDPDFVRREQLVL